MNTIVSSSAQQPAAATSVRTESALLPPVDVIEDANGITLYADLPGVDRDHLHVRIDGDQLVIEGEFNLPVAQGTVAHHAEVSLSHYRRVFTLSKELDADRISAELSQGELRLRIPKAPHAQPRKVTVRVA